MGQMQFSPLVGCLFMFGLLYWNRVFVSRFLGGWCAFERGWRLPEYSGLRPPGRKPALP
ncbi:hypothetical protein SCHPADRAFT_532340 [Schizopora paradoxa]|uniref:Uncharacterized protein n=1 Tax=Schizopora paradoxa TaxID=27342 RepID=A0A0H2RZG1_9AGAM|nr:hypothetical protein SCHPADRAFT_532340 [Schizopora paradoxa]